MISILQIALWRSWPKLAPKTELAFIADVAGLVSGRGPELPFVTSIDQIELLASSWSPFEPGSEFQLGTHQSSQAPRMFLVLFLNQA